MSEAGRVPEGGPARERAIARLAQHDPAERLLDLKVCDPAMGSGHFLVNLVDYLADRVIAAMAEAEAEVEGYVSPLADRIETIRERIAANAAERRWVIDLDRLDDRHIVRRMVLKRCVYGVDKNPMAVELAKVALWLHTFTVGAPLSFLDHHLRCGDSLFGASARGGIDKAAQYGGPLLLHGSVTQAERSVGSMQRIEDLTDAEIAEAHRSVRSVRRSRSSHRTAQGRPVPGACDRLAERPGPGRHNRAAILLRRAPRRPHRDRARKSRGIDGATGECALRRTAGRSAGALSWRSAFSIGRRLFQVSGQIGRA